VQLAVVILNGADFNNHSMLLLYHSHEQGQRRSLNLVGRKVGVGGSVVNRFKIFHRGRCPSYEV